MRRTKNLRFAFLCQAPATTPEAEAVVVIQQDRPAGARGI
jgi:hypothetical protein